MTTPESLRRLAGTPLAAGFEVVAEMQQALRQAADEIERLEIALHKAEEIVQACIDCDEGSVYFLRDSAKTYFKGKP